MKDLSNSTAKHARHPVYPKKRPSPHRDGVAKWRSKQSPIPLAVRRTPQLLRAELMRQRQAQLLAFRKDGIYVEEEYREEIQFYMHEMEKYTMSSAASMDTQPEIRWHMRPDLVDFLVEIHFTFRLRPETLYLTLNIVDRYVSRRIVYTKHYQLVGCAALWIAAKFEDSKERVPTVQDLVHICREAYDEAAFIQMEGHVLATIQWTLGHPTAEAWLRFYCCGGTCIDDFKVQHVARFLMELTLFYREFIQFAPSQIASASLTLARYSCQKPRRLYEESPECLEIVELLDSRLAESISDVSETLIKKYSFAYYSKASTHIIQWYLVGNRFCRNPWTSFPPPVTPTSSRTPLSAISTPMSTMTMSSDSYSDDTMPPTPSSAYVEPIVSVHISSGPNSDKENVPMAPETFVPVASKQIITSESYGRPALHDLNMLAPSPHRIAV